MRTILRSRTAAVIAALAVALTMPTPASAADGPDLVVNGSFEQFGGALPDSWTRWAPAGTGTITRVDGVTGTNAVQVTTDTVSSRLALVQDVPVSDGLYRLDFQTRRTGMAGTGTAGIRVNVAGATSTPFLGGSTDTAGWQPVSGWVRVPTGATSARLHVFNDAIRGSMAVDDVRLVRVDASDVLTASVSAAGDIGLQWEVGDRTGIVRYDIHRSASPGADPLASAPIRSVPASVTAATDQDWRPGAAYTYVVIGRDAAGAEKARTVPASIDAPKTSNILSSSLAAIEIDGAAHLSWAASRDTTGTLSLYEADHSLQDGDLSEARVVASAVEPVGSTDVAATGGHFALAADGRVVATASLAGTAHPRLMLADDVQARIHRLIAKPGTPQQMYQTITARVDGGMATFGASPERYAREAAFLYVITGEQRYADAAYTGFSTAAGATPFGKEQELNTANPSSQLALAYDWAYNGWSEQQRAFAREYFERVSAFLELGSHPNMTRDDKGSNWVGVTRGAELAVHLAVRGDGDHGLRDARIARLLDQLIRHNEQAMTPGGWFQEGLDYLDYDSMIMNAGVLSSFDAGIDAVKSAWHAPATVDMLLHANSFRTGSTGSSLQFGVGTGQRAVLALYFDRAAAAGELSRYTALFERTYGAQSSAPKYSPAYALPLLQHWPEDGVADLQSERPLPALIDDVAGSAMFRNRLQDADDVLVGLTNRNHHHLGWSGYETFGLSMIGGDTAWAQQPGKDQSNAAKYSRVLVDGKAVQQVGQGRTLGSQVFSGQGGGYVHFDGSGNLGVQKATREAVVDMSPRPEADAVLALSDSFADTASHRWTWQLAPQAGVTAEIGGIVDGTRSVTLRHDDAWLRIWLKDADGAAVTFTDGVLRIVRDGVAADFDVVMAAGASGAPANAEVMGSIVSLGGFTADLDHLDRFAPASAQESWTQGARYQTGATVSHEGRVYTALRPNDAKAPGAEADGPWQEMAQAADSVLWTASRRFESGDRVLHRGDEYTTNRPTRGEEPGTADSPWS